MNTRIAPFIAPFTGCFGLIFDGYLLVYSHHLDFCWDVVEKTHGFIWIPSISTSIHSSISRITVPRGPRSPCARVSRLKGFATSGTAATGRGASAGAASQPLNRTTDGVRDDLRIVYESIMFMVYDSMSCSLLSLPRFFFNFFGH